MIQFIKNLLGFSPPIDYSELLQKGAVIVDVRTKEEYRSGHIKGSINIPLQDLKRDLPKLNKDKPLIVCCASGMRSASAKSILKSNGFTEAHNGGGWLSLQRKIR